MGQETSTPLSLMTDDFSDFKSRAQSLSVLVKKSKLITFCSAEWPTFHVGWPSEGTFDLGTVHQVRDIVFRPRIGHPGQVPYIIVWENIILHPPPWVKPFLPQQGFSTAQVLVTRVGKNPKNPKEPEPTELLYPILQGGVVRGSTLIETAHPGQHHSNHLHELFYDRRS